MQINIKLKFDPKKNKAQPLWDKNKKPYFLENTEFKHKNKDLDLALPNSFRQFHEIPHQEPTKTYREHSRDVNTQQQKRSQSKRRSKSKQSRESPVVSRKNGQMKKNISDVIKVPKKKLSVVNNLNLQEEETFRGSLPGLSGKKVLQRYAPILSQNQKIQLINEKTVYYIGVGASAGEDDQDGSYLWRKHEQVGYRYELLECLGSGAFGEVIKAFDHKNKETVAIKIIKSKKQHMQLALNEINILMRTKEKDIDNQKNIVRIKDFIVFRKHICIVTELLSISLYDLIEANQFQPLQMHHIRTFAIQILNALAFLMENSIIHSDLKPENVLLKNKSKTGIKLIDFGTSMFSHEANYMYIQSRFYRAPEVMLGMPYSYPIDMWSLGCLLAELHLGEPLFAGSNEKEQLSLIMQTLGLPPKQVFVKGKNVEQFFKDGTLDLVKTKEGNTIIPGEKPLSLIIKNKLLYQFLSKIFLFKPSERLTPLDALLHPWIIDGLPSSIREQHLSYVKLKLKKHYESMEEQRQEGKNSVKKHTKRNSELVIGEKSTHHKRRRSDGLN